MPIDPSSPMQVQQGSPFQSMGQATQALSGLAQLQNVRQQNQMMQAETQNLQQTASQVRSASWATPVWMATATARWIARRSDRQRLGSWPGSIATEMAA